MDNNIIEIIGSAIAIIGIIIAVTYGLRLKKLSSTNTNRLKMKYTLGEIYLSGSFDLPTKVAVHEKKAKNRTALKQQILVYELKDNEEEFNFCY